MSSTIGYNFQAPPPAKDNHESSLKTTYLDTFDEKYNTIGHFKVVEYVKGPNREAYAICEQANERTKAGQFKDWLTHKVTGEYTDRDKSKFDTSRIIVNAIREELKEQYPTAKAMDINRATNHVVMKSTGDRVFVLQDDPITLDPVPLDRPVQSSYTSKYPHAFNSSELMVANNMLHNSELFSPLAKKP